MDNNNLSGLPMNTIKEVPTPKESAQNITGLVKKSGRVTGYQLSDGQLVDKEQAISMARQGDIAGVGISSRNGSEYLKSLPDGSESNNLSSLPTVATASD